MLEFLFDKVADLQTCNYIKERLQHRCFPARFAKFLRTFILKNNYERLLLRVFQTGPQSTFCSIDQTTIWSLSWITNLHFTVLILEIVRIVNLISIIVMTYYKKGKTADGISAVLLQRISKFWKCLILILEWGSSMKCYD